jgi:CheY-like chemotaxis protein
MLTTIDYEVKVKESGEKAVRTVIEHPEEFDLVLTDLMARYEGRRNSGKNQICPPDHSRCRDERHTG